MAQYLNKLKSYVEKHDFLSNPRLYVRIFRPPFIREIIKEILSDSFLLNEVASLSYTHYNGFDKIVIYQTKSTKLRIHIWENTTYRDLIDENIHNHRWDFITSLLTGSYYLKIYQKSDKGKIYHCYSYLPPDCGEYYKMEYEGQEKLKGVFSTKISSGNFYVIDKEVFHKVKYSNMNYTATLMLHNENSENNINVYSKKIIENNFNLPAKRFSISELEEKLNKFITKMDIEVQRNEFAWNRTKERDELINIVDENDEILGQLPRRFFYRNNIKNYRVINAFIQNKKGQLFILRRSADKDLFPLGLDMSVGGHVKAGETYEDALKRETKEELNIDLDNFVYKEIGYLSPLNTKISSFSKTYLIESNQTPSYNKNEFIEGFWLFPEEIIQRIEKGDLHKDDLPILISQFFLI